MRRDVLWLLGASAVLFLVLLPFSGYVAALPFLREEWRLTNAASGLVFSAYLVGNAAAALLLVPLTDRTAPGRIGMAGVGLLVLSHILFPIFARGFYSACVLRILAGAGHVAAYVPGIQIVSRRFARGPRGTAVGLFVAAGYAGTTLSYVFFGQLLRHASWREAYLVTALVGLPGVLAAPFLLGGSDETSRTVTRGRLSLEVFRSRAMGLVNAAYALHTAELYLARLWFPQLLGALFLATGKTPASAASSAATLSGLMFTLGIAGVFLGGLLSDVLGRTASAILFFSLSGACSLLVAWLPSSLFLPVGFLYGFTTAADSAVYSTAITELASPERLGSAQAVQAFTGFLAGALAPVVAGAILDRTPSENAWGLTFTFNAALAAIGVAALAVLRRLPEAQGLAAGRR